LLLGKLRDRKAHLPNLLESGRWRRYKMAFGKQRSATGGL
jgi:hypothetical protein